MKPLSALCHLCMLALSISVSFADAPETVSLAERPRMALYAEEVTIDGKPRPDLARALADTLGTSLLKRGQVRLFSLESAATQDATGMIASSNQIGSAQRLQRLMDEGLDYILTFNVVGIGGHHLLSVKKTRARTSEVVESHQYTSIGRETGLFKLIAQVMEAVDPLPYGKSGVFPRSQSPAEYWPAPKPETPEYVIARALPAGPAVVTDDETEYDPWQENLAPAPSYDLSRVPKALVYRHLGTVNYINPTWKFCIIDPVRGYRFQEQDPMHILWDEGDVYAHLRVSAVEREGVVLDMGRTPDHHPIFKGDKVYGWAPLQPR
ncbi:hypothetical protein [Brevifollis gellanilyticus]|nr:hypothetical protein [Brevifollis gellanilyticus]